MMPAAEQASGARASVEAAKKEEEQRSQAAAQAHHQAQQAAAQSLAAQQQGGDGSPFVCGTPGGLLDMVISVTVPQGLGPGMPLTVRRRSSCAPHDRYEGLKI